MFAIRALEDNHIARSLYTWGKAISLAKIRYVLSSLAFPSHKERAEAATADSHVLGRFWWGLKVRLAGVI